MLIVASLAFLTSCATSLPASLPTADLSAKPQTADQPAKLPVEQPRAKQASDAPPSGPTLAERAARYEMIVQAQPTPGVSSTAPAGKDYQEGYPRLAPAPKARGDGSLQSFLALDTGPYLANHVVHNLTWANNSGRTLAIYKAYFWTGFDKGGIGDVHIEARRTSDNSYIGILQWDHYADPTLPQHGQQFDYVLPMILDPGDSITIKHFANGLAPGWHAHHLLILWIK